MVCLGNICRSPLAEGILKAKVKECGLSWSVDSAGTSNWHEGEHPDRRGVAIGLENGVDISHQRARQFQVNDFDKFDLILAMDSSNYHSICSLTANPAQTDKVKIIMNFLSPGKNIAVPDPYYDNRFPQVFEMLTRACEKIIDYYRQDTN